MTQTKYIVSWKTEHPRTSKGVSFVTLEGAKSWYNKKLVEGKEPQLWIETRKKLK